MINRPKLARDWVGLQVTNRKSLETQGGVIFPPNTRFEVTGVWRGFRLETVIQCPEGCPHCGIQHRHTIREVKRHELDILEAGFEIMSENEFFLIEIRAEIKVLEKARDFCIRHALQWGDAYKNRSPESTPSEYLVWRGRAIEAAATAQTLTNLLSDYKDH